MILLLLRGKFGIFFIVPPVVLRVPEGYYHTRHDWYIADIHILSLLIISVEM